VVNLFLAELPLAPRERGKLCFGIVLGRHLVGFFVY
jgi:hypothetical protein